MRSHWTAIILIIALFAIGAIGLFFYIELTPEPQMAPVVRRMGFSKPEIIGFQPFWLVSEGKQSYDKDITTLTYFSLALEKDGTIRREDTPGEQEPGVAMLSSDLYEATLSAHRKAGVKLSLLVQNMVEEDILELVAEPEAHARTMMNELDPIMRKHGFTDLNLDIESFNKASDSARMGYVRFVRTVKDELTRLGLGTLTVELTPKSPVEMHLIDVARVAEIADYVVLMAYDYHYLFSSVAGPIAPIGGVPTTAEYDVETALVETLRYAPASKVLLGVPSYGYEWETLTNRVGAAVIPGSWQLATGKRMGGYIRDCKDCTKGWDAIAKEPYVIFPGETERHYQQAFYENKQALEEKIALAKKYQIAGVAVWALGYESDGMYAPLSVYKKHVQNRGFSSISVPDYTLVQPASLTLNPPTHALVGSIATMSGTVLKMGRQDDQYQPYTSAGPLVQGESIATGEDGRIEAVLPGAVSFTIASFGELSFSEVLPPTIFLRQKNGTVTYTRDASADTDVSVRVLQTLVQLIEGEVEVSVDGARAELFQKTGSSLLGTIDADNVTTTYDLTAGQRAVVDSDQESVKIR